MSDLTHWCAGCKQVVAADHSDPAKWSWHVCGPTLDIGDAFRMIQDLQERVDALEKNAPRPTGDS